MPRNIILEGPDGAGKTTLAQTLNKAGYGPIVHLGPPDKFTPPLEEYLNALHRYKNVAIFDRLHLGERIYGKILRKNDRLGIAGQRMLERVMLSMDVRVILCLPPWEVAHDNWIKRAREGKELTVDPVQYAEIYHGYAAMYHETALPTWQYDYTQTTAIDTLIDMLEQPVRANAGPGIGNFRRGSTLIVGDQVNPRVALYDYPFVASGKGASSFITEQLEVCGVGEECLYWINAYDSNGYRTDGSFIERLSPRRIVALGARAGRWCRDLEVEHRQIPHPAFWRRFHFNEEYTALHDAVVS